MKASKKKSISNDLREAKENIALTEKKECDFLKYSENKRKSEKLKM